MWQVDAGSAVYSPLTLMNDWSNGSHVQQGSLLWLGTDNGRLFSVDVEDPSSLMEIDLPSSAGVSTAIGLATPSSGMTAHCKFVLVCLRKGFCWPLLS